MDCENGRRLNTNANVPDDRGEKPKPPFSIANSDRSSTSSRTDHGGKGSSPAKISDSSHNLPLPVEASSRPVPSAVNSPESTKRSSDTARDSFVQTESPVIQVMERPKTSDPNTADDGSNRWSVDSNDSLFSLRMGSDSFTNGHSLRISGVQGLGELSLSEAYLPRVSSPHRSESRNSPSLKAIDETRKDAKEDPKPGYKEPNIDSPEASISMEHTDSNLSQSTDSDPSNDDNKSRNESSPSPSRKESSCPLLSRYSCCNKMDGCCRWLSCSCCRWPSCSWFKWPSCCSSCPSCCRFCSKCRCPISFASCCCCFGWKCEPKRVRLMDRNVARSSKRKL